MSRFSECDYEVDYANQAELWEANARRALAGKRGRKALAELREALLALPEKRLISGALCTVGPSARMAGMGEFSVLEMQEKVVSEGEGVCAIGAFLWHRKVKAGADPRAAFEELPTLLDADGGSWETAEAGQAAGLTYTLAWMLAYRNDETFEAMTPEERYTAFLRWIDDRLAEPIPPTRPRQPHRAKRGHRGSEAVTPAAHPDPLPGLAPPSLPEVDGNP